LKSIKLSFSLTECNFGEWVSFDYKLAEERW
jgi:hypothetical protein